MSKIKTAKGSYVEDITGQTFNRLTVLELTDKQNNDNRWLWKCQCSCEKHSIVYASMHNLKSGKTKSCGCLKSEKCAQRNRDNTLDLTNTKIGMLMPIKLLDTPDGKQKRWLCKCDCGNYVEVLLGELRRDNYGDDSRHSTLSCGCMKRSAGEALIAKYLINIILNMNQKNIFLVVLILKQMVVYVLIFIFQIITCVLNLMASSILKLVNGLGQKKLK